MKVPRFLVRLLLVLSLTCCTPKIPSEALQLGPESVALRQLQSRKFDTKNEKDLLVAAAGVLQDLGFNIDESETGLGVIVGSKERDATDTGQIVGSVVLAILFNTPVEYDSQQKIRASVVTKPSGKVTSLRVTFQRMVWNTRNALTRIESLNDPLLYQDFFEKLSKAVFLSANEI